MDDIARIAATMRKHIHRVKAERIKWCLLCADAGKVALELERAMPNTPPDIVRDAWRVTKYLERRLKRANAAVERIKPYDQPRVLTGQNRRLKMSDAAECVREAVKCLFIGVVFLLPLAFWVAIYTLVEWWFQGSEPSISYWILAFVRWLFMGTFGAAVAIMPIAVLVYVLAAIIYMGGRGQ